MAAERLTPAGENRPVSGMAARQGLHYAAGPQSPRQRGRLARSGDMRLPPSANELEPLVFNNSISYEDFVYPSFAARRASIWSDATIVPSEFGVGAFAGTGKLTGIDASDLPYATGPAYMPSTASSVAGLSTISRTSSLCSPVLTESPSGFSRTPLTPRGPSPLRTSTEALSAVLDKTEGWVSRSDERQQDKGGLNAQGSIANPHICLWGNNGVCRGSNFATREELNQHVKLEHLLECPVISCTETAFDSRELLACHMRWSHSSNDASNITGCRSANLLEGNLTLSHDVPNDSPAGSAVISRMNPIEDKVLKMEMSIGIYKKRCREQLRAVLEKRSRRVGGPLRSANSPDTSRSRTPKPLESASFPVIWEHGVLPFLIEFMPKWCGPGHVISVTRGRKPNTRRICLMTRRTLTKARKMIIASHVRDLLPEPHRAAISFVFSTGKVNRLVWSRGLSKEMPDDVCEPRNPFAYISPCMGDSIGTSLHGEEATATLGPSVTADGGSFWLACFHPFMSADNRTSPVLIEHPSPQDRAHCMQEQHDVLDSLDHSLGKLTATSGYDLKTTRVTHDPYWEDSDKEPPLVVTDWILISHGTEKANLLRRFPSVAPRREIPVTSTSPVTPGASVVSTGRTSGFQRGQICEIPAYVDGTENGTGKRTREWFIEEPFPYDNENEWIRGGIGVEGDSGAAIIDSDTNALVGQLWGRNNYWGPGPRLTFFTPISDIFDDIQEKCGMSARPQLPQYRDEADRWPVYPVCKQCFDLQEYLDSRRSSRESMMSMIGVHDARGEHDNDLTSVSELATPKDHQSYLIRHVGAEEAASPFGGGNAVSPAPVHAFYSASQAASPGVSDLRSPYPQALNEEDLYEPTCPRTSEVACGKRPAVLPPHEDTARHVGKRIRTTYGRHA